MHDVSATDPKLRWTAFALAVPIAPLHPGQTCAEVYDIMAADESYFGAAIVEDGKVLGLADRISLITQFARPYWREVYARHSIARLMDASPLIVEAHEAIDSISLRIATENKAALNAGFVVVSDGRYIGVGNSISLLKLTADQAHARNQELSAAHREIRELNEVLEQRVAERTAELYAVQNELVQKERLSALGQLTATVAHELRNPLSSIRNTLYSIRTAVSSSGIDLERQIGRGERSVARCDRIIADLLDFTRACELRCSNVIADRWLDEVLADQPIPADLQLIKKLTAADQRIALDTDRMRQVIANLVENAVHAVSDPAVREKGGAITIASRNLPAHYEIVVEDNGVGIPEDVLPRIFEPLFSTKAFGTGLGLPMVKKVVEQHGGAIDFASRVGVGTTVSIRIPTGAPQSLAA